MKSIIRLMFCLYPLFFYAQEESQTDPSAAAKEVIITEEKEALKKDIEAINLRWEQNEISKNEADELKKAAAEKRAANIENRVAILENQMALEERNMEDKTGEKADSDTLSQSKKIIVNLRNKRGVNKRTTSGPVIAFGFNNVITDGESINQSDFRVGGSRFFEIGWSWKTRVFEDNNWLRVKYGLNFQFNGLKPIDNKYFVDAGEETVLEEFPHPLSKSKFRMDNLVVPVHFEFGPYKTKEREGGVKYSTHNNFRIGLGGYAGLNISTRQKLKYTEDGRSRKQKIKEDYNSANIIYGISTYVGWSSFSLYAKYDLNPIFRNNPIDQRNISLGMRLDWD